MRLLRLIKFRLRKCNFYFLKWAHSMTAHYTINTVIVVHHKPWNPRFLHRYTILQQHTKTLLSSHSISFLQGNPILLVLFYSKNWCHIVIITRIQHFLFSPLLIVWFFSVKMSIGEVACSYSLMILHDDNIAVTVSFAEFPSIIN
jgi:hypothetical protein